MDGDEVAQHNFPLPTLSRRLGACAEAVHLGRGFCIVRGLEMSKFSMPDSVVVFLGIASHIAEKRGLQDRKGNMLCKSNSNSPIPSSPFYAICATTRVLTSIAHVTDSKEWTTPVERRHGIHTNAALVSACILSLEFLDTDYR